MIISASRRTDIPAFYSDWLLRRLETGTVLVPNPWNPNLMGHVLLTPKNVDCIVFWTKNPAPLEGKLSRIDRLGYRYYFTFTVTGYGADLEQNLPPKEEILSTFQRLSDRVGPMRVDWRFDPILINNRYTIQWHIDTFADLCRKIGPATQRCIINFVKFYPHIPSKIIELNNKQIQETTKAILRTAAEFQLPVFTCTENSFLQENGIGFSSCIDPKKIEQLVGRPVKAKKDPGQPKNCHCIESVDIGMYDSCMNGCTYCYAMHNEERVRRRMAEHDIESPMLIGHPTGTEKITDRTRLSMIDDQRRLF